MARRRIAVAGWMAIVAAGATLAAWQAASAQSGGVVADRFRQADANQDGKLTEAEVANLDLFRRLDRDRNGEVTLAEARLAVAAGALKAVLTPAPASAPPANSPTEPATDSASEPATDSASEPASDPAAGPLPEVREAPKVLKPGDHGVGRLVPDVAFTDLAGQRHRLSDFADRKALVLVMTGAGCPLCQKYAPTLAALEKRYSDRGVTFVYLNPTASETKEEARQAVAAYGFAGPYVRDFDQQLSRSLGATSTTEAFVLDAARTLVYRGAVDDQYGFAYALEQPRREYLADALEQVLAGERPSTAATTAPGCELFYDAESPAGEPAVVTYHNRVSRILQSHCLECHRDGGVAPFALDSYEAAKDYAGMIRRVVERGIMPPWFAAPHERASTADALPGERQATGVYWANERSLADSERSDLLAWIAAGAPRGDAADAPLPRSFPDGWLIGKPDAIYEFPRPVPIKATGVMPYQNITVETHLPEDKWVQAIEIRPGDPRVVHHVLVFVTAGDDEEAAGRGSRRDSAEEERRGYWGIYVPGNSTLVYPDGFAKRLPKGAKLRFQMHYTPNGKATEDVTQIGVVFAKQPPEHEVRVTGIVNGRLRIPPGAPNHEEVASLRLPYDVQVLAFLPHMHLRGKAARFDALTQSGSRTLLDVPRYDFNWQLLYRLATPLDLSAGDTIRFTAWFDNSAENPANPDPTKEVRWGQQTYDEMHLGYVEYIVPGAKPGEAVGGMRRAQVAGAVQEGVDDALFRRLDVNADGRITLEEARKRVPNRGQTLDRTFHRLDTDGNGTLDKAELSRLRRLGRGS